MKEIKGKLRSEILEDLEGLGEEELGSTEWQESVDGVAKLVDRAIEIEKMESEREEKTKQMKDENRDRIIRNGISIAGIVIPSVIAVWGTVKTFKFDEAGGIVTSSMGRSFIQKLLPKK